MCLHSIFRKRSRFREILTHAPGRKCSDYEIIHNYSNFTHSLAKSSRLCLVTPGRMRPDSRGAVTSSFSAIRNIQKSIIIGLLLLLNIIVEILHKVDKKFEVFYRVASIFLEQLFSAQPPFSLIQYMRKFIVPTSVTWWSGPYNQSTCWQFSLEASFWI